MSDSIRLRDGDTNPVVAAVDSATVIEIGDLVWQDTDDAKSASMLTEDRGGMALLDLTNQTPGECFARNFLGVAMQRSRSGEANLVRVATTGVFEFDVLAGDCFELGDLIGVSCYDVSGIQRLQNQQVTKVTSSKYAIARVAKRVSSADTTVLVDIYSTVMRGGIAGSSPSGV